MKIWEGTVESATNSKLGTASARSPVVVMSETVLVEIAATVITAAG